MNTKGCFTHFLFHLSSKASTEIVSMNTKGCFTHFLRPCFRSELFHALCNATPSSTQAAQVVPCSAALLATLAFAAASRLEDRGGNMGTVDHCGTHPCT